MLGSGLVSGLLGDVHGVVSVDARHREGVSEGELSKKFASGRKVASAKCVGLQKKCVRSGRLEIAK